MSDYSVEMWNKAMEMFRSGKTSEEMYIATGINLDMATRESNVYDRAARRKSIKKLNKCIPQELLRKWDKEIYGWYQEYKKRHGVST